jgi:hypothetical protein
MKFVQGTCRVITSCNPWSTEAKSRLCSRTSKRLAWGSLLTVLTTKIQPSKPWVREEYTTSFMHIFYTNKVPRVLLQFLWTGAHLGEKRNQRATRARHGRPCQVRPHLPRATSSVPIKSFPTCTFGWTRLIKETSVWSNGWSCDHLDQWVHLSGQSTATTVIPRQSSMSLSEGGSSHGSG